MKASPASTRRFLIGCLLIAWLPLGLTVCQPDGSIFIPYVTSRSKKIEIKPQVVTDAAPLRVGGHEVAVRLQSESGAVSAGRVKLRFHHVIGAITELRDDVWAEWRPDLPGGGAFVAQQVLDVPGQWRVDVLLQTDDGKRGEAQAYFTVAPA